MDKRLKVIDVLDRVSSSSGRDMDAETTHTLNQQHAAQEAFLKMRGWRIGKRHTYIDQSGFTMLGKIQDEMLARVRAGKTRGLVVGYGDRLCRNWMEGGEFMGKMLKEDADIWDAQDPMLDYRTDHGRTMWGVKLVVNETASLSAKKRGNDLANDLVFKYGAASHIYYGYKRNGVIVDGVVVSKVLADRHPKVAVRDEATAPVVVRIFKMKDGGNSLDTIADALNGDGISSPSGGHWTKSTIAAVLKNRAYLGEVKMGERVNEEAHEPLVSRALWQRCQSTRTQVRNGRLVAGIAGGVLRCSTCGHTLSVTGQGHGGRASYGCRRKTVEDGRCSRPMYVSKDRADAFVEGIIVELLDSGEGIDVVTNLREVETAHLAAIAATEAREAFADRVEQLDPDDFNRIYAKRKAEEKAAWEHYETVRDNADEGQEDFPKDATAWRALDAEHKSRVVRQVIATVNVLPPLSRSKNALIEDRFEVTSVSGDKMASGRWLRAA
jgi:hypothetical protein